MTEQKSKKRILCLGNSNTYGYDPRGAFGGRYPETVRWTGRLAAGWEVFNRGMNGGMVPTEGMTAALLDLAESLRPLDVITVMFGTNDVLRGGSAETAGEQMEQFVRALKERMGEATQLLLIAPPPVTYGDWVQSESVIRQSAALSGVYRRAAAAVGARFADAGAWGVGLEFDGVHFTAAGHGAFYEGLLRALTD